MVARRLHRKIQIIRSAINVLTYGLKHKLQNTIILENNCLFYRKCMAFSIKVRSLIQTHDGFSLLKKKSSLFGLCRENATAAGF